MNKPIDESQTFDELLAQGFLKPPEDFTAQVMRAVQPLPLPIQNTDQPMPDTWRTLAKWLAVLGGAALGAAELVAFMFGLWTASTAS